MTTNDLYYLAELALNDTDRTRQSFHGIFDPAKLADSLLTLAKEVESHEMGAVSVAIFNSRLTPRYWTRGPYELCVLKARLAAIEQSLADTLRTKVAAEKEIAAHKARIAQKDAALRLALDAFEKNHAIDWNELEKAIGPTPAAKRGDGSKPGCETCDGVGTVQWESAGHTTVDPCPKCQPQPRSSAEVEPRHD